MLQICHSSSSHNPTIPHFLYPLPSPSVSSGVCHEPCDPFTSSDGWDCVICEYSSLSRDERTSMSSNRYPGSVSERGVLCLVEMSFCPTMFVCFFSFVWTWINWNKNVIFWNWSHDWKLKLKLWKQNILPFAMDSIRESFRMWLHLLQLYYSSSIQNNYWYI